MRAFYLLILSFALVGCSAQAPREAPQIICNGYVKTAEGVHREQQVRIRLEQDHARMDWQNHHLTTGSLSTQGQILRAHIPTPGDDDERLITLRDFYLNQETGDYFLVDNAVDFFSSGTCILNP